MSSGIEDKLEQIMCSLARIEKALNIVPDRETTINDYDSSIGEYEKFAKEDLNLAQNTIENQKSTILGFLNHSNGKINKDTIKDYLNSNDSSSWRTNQLKALRRYTRDFLKLGNWINEFDFSKTRAKLKEIPGDEQIREFFEYLPYQGQLAFLILYNSGLRIGEVLSLKVSNINFDTNMVNVSDVHEGDTKYSWISFITKQTSQIIQQYLSTANITDTNSKIFPVTKRTIQKMFQDTSEYVGIAITPHLMRTIFAEKCTKVGMQDKYINAFCGRVSQGILAKHYTDYSPARLREIYDKVEPHLTL